MPAGAARAWAASWGAPAWRPSSAGSTCACWPSLPAVDAAGVDELLELGPGPGQAAVADPAHHQVGVLVEGALVDQNPGRPQAGHDGLVAAEEGRPQAVRAAV